MPIANIGKEDITEMTELRKADICTVSPDINRQDFSSEEEYRQALIKNYQALRQEEYELTVQNECMKVYNLAKDGYLIGEVENKGVWNGYTSYINASKISATEKERRKQQVQDCAISRAPEMAGICMNGSKTAIIGRNNSCAITAAAITAQVSAKMGYDGEENLMQAKYRGKNPSMRNNIVAAQGIAQNDSIPDQYKRRIEPISRTNPNTKKKTTNTPTLNELIANGTIGVGDAFSVKTGQGSNTSTGYHALTLAAVEKDKDGKIIGYTLQGNNNRRFSSHKINEKNFYSDKPVYNVANTHAWMNDKIKTEAKNLEKLTTAELETTIAQQKEKTLSVTEDLGKTETYAFEKKYCQDNVVPYFNTLINKRTQYQTPLPDENKENQTPVTPTSTKATNHVEKRTPFKSARVDYRIEVKNKTPEEENKKEKEKEKENKEKENKKNETNTNLPFTLRKVTDEERKMLEKNKNKNPLPIKAILEKGKER